MIQMFNEQNIIFWPSTAQTAKGTEGTTPSTGGWTRKMPIVLGPTDNGPSERFTSARSVYITVCPPN